MYLLKLLILFGLCCSPILCTLQWSSSNVLNSTVRQGVQPNRPTSCRIDVCFAIDGSNSIDKSEFRSALQFAQLISSIILDIPNASGAVQYGMKSYPIVSITEDKDFVLHSLENTESKEDDKISIAAGIAACDSQLAQRQAPVSKIVVIGTGENNFGDDPIMTANKFRARNRNGKIAAVSIGKYSNTEMLHAIADDGNIFGLREYIKLALSIDSLYSDVCGP